MSSNITANSLRSIHELVKDGAGINWGPTWLYRKDLKEGKLVRVLPLKQVKGLSIHAVYTSRAYLPLKTKMFIKLLSESIKSDEIK